MTEEISRDVRMPDIRNSVIYKEFEKWKRISDDYRSQFGLLGTQIDHPVSKKCHQMCMAALESVKNIAKEIYMEGIIELFNRTYEEDQNA